MCSPVHKVGWGKFKNIHCSYLVLKMCIIHFVICRSLLKLKEPVVPFYSIGAQSHEKKFVKTLSMYFNNATEIYGNVFYLLPFVPVLCISVFLSFYVFQHSTLGFKAFLCFS